MCEILENQTLEVEHLLCYRGRATNAELDMIGRDMDRVIREAGAKRAGHPITATFGIENGKMDMELMLPTDQKIGNIKDYYYKDRIKIVNAVMAVHEGNPGDLQRTCNELNQYILEKKLMPITVGYSVPKEVDKEKMENSRIHVYVGISPNIL